MNKQMRKAMREVKKQADARVKGHQLERDAEGRVVIDMTVENDDGFLSAFSENDTPVIATDVAEFIEDSTEPIKLGEPLTLRIHSTCIDESEQIVYTEAIREYYAQRYVAIARELRRNRWIVLALALAGVAVLAGALYYEHHVGNAIGTEVIDIVAWVLLWEATDIGVFGNRAAKLKKLRYLSFLGMKVEYVGVESSGK